MFSDESALFLKAIPRVVSFDVQTGSNLIQWPVHEMEKLRTSSERFEHIKLHAGSVIPLEVPMATQVGIFLITILILGKVCFSGGKVKITEK